MLIYRGDRNKTGMSQAWLFQLILLLRGAGTGFVGVLPLPVIFDPLLYTTFHREAKLKLL